MPLDRQFCAAAAVAAANAAAATEPQMSDALDDEVSQITLGQKKDSQVKSQPLPLSMPLSATTTAKKPDENIDFGLPNRGAFSDAHDGQPQYGQGDRKASISTQADFSLPEVLQQTISAGNTASFEPTSTRHSDVTTTKTDDTAGK